MKKILSVLLVLALLMTTGCSLPGKNSDGAKKMDAFLKAQTKVGIEAAADKQICLMDKVPTVYKTIIEADEYDYILIDP